MTFKKIWLLVGGILFTLLTAGMASAASPPVWTSGLIPYDEALIGVRYRSFGNTAGEEIYLGIPDLGLSANRLGANITWAELNKVAFSYDPVKDELTTEVDPGADGLDITTLTYQGVSSQIAALGKEFTLADLNIMQITIANGDEGTTVNLNDVFLSNADFPDGVSFGSFGGNGTFDWMLQNFDFVQGFKITGMIHLLGAFSSNQDLSKIEINVGHLSPNAPPDCSKAGPNLKILWPPDHRWVKVKVLGVTDPNGDPITLKIDSIYQDEPVDGEGDGNTAPDGKGIGDPWAWVRAERQGLGNGRVYHIAFTADDGKGGTCSGEVRVGVPKSTAKKHRVPVDDGALYDSTVP